MNPISPEPPSPVRRRWLSLVGCIVLCHAAGGLGALSMRSETTWAWYRALQKPPINPPDWVFGPVWAVLYTLMAVALWLILQNGRGKPGFGVAIGAFVVQLALNAAWTPLFFGMQSIGGALADIMAMVLAIGFTIFSFAMLHRPAALLMLPYAAWIAFAAVLNAWLWRLNG